MTDFVNDYGEHFHDETFAVGDLVRRHAMAKAFPDDVPLEGVVRFIYRVHRTSHHQLLRVEDDRLRDRRHAVEMHQALIGVDASDDLAAMFYEHARARVSPEVQAKMPKAHDQEFITKVHEQAAAIIAENERWNPVSGCWFEKEPAE